MIALLASIALAGTLGPGLLLPGAAPVDGAVTIGARTGLGRVGWCGSPCVVGGGELGISRGRWAAGLSVVGGGYSLATLGVRFVATDTPHLRFAPFVTIAPASFVLDWSEGDHGRPWLGCLACAGVAVDAGWERLRGDVSVGVVGLAASFEVRPDVVMAESVEAGISVIPAEGHRLRVGVESVAPVASYRYSGGPIYAEVMGSPPLRVPLKRGEELQAGGLVQLTVGARIGRQGVAVSSDGAGASAAQGSR